MPTAKQWSSQTKISAEKCSCDSSDPSVKQHRLSSREQSASGDKARTMKLAIKGSRRIERSTTTKAGMLVTRSPKYKRVLYRIPGLHIAQRALNQRQASKPKSTTSNGVHSLSYDRDHWPNKANKATRQELCRPGMSTNSNPGS
eukprot:5776120-Amphidinium_carterae.8